MVADGELTLPERDTLLAEMTDEVGALVLRDNYEQASALGNAMAQARSLLPVHRRLISELERTGRLDRALEAMPTDEELARAWRGRAGPDVAGVRGAARVREDRPGRRDRRRRRCRTTRGPPRCWPNYFPTPLRERYADRMAEHRLRREIITTVLVNEVVNRGGITFVYRAVEETGATAADVIRAYVIVRDVYGLRDAVDARSRRSTRTRPCRPPPRPRSTWRPAA